MDSRIYITHTCKNSKLKPTVAGKGKNKIITPHPDYCDRAFVDVDKYNSQSPPTWKYCAECVAKGFKNPKTRKSTKTPEQIEAFKQRMKEYRNKRCLMQQTPSET